MSGYLLNFSYWPRVGQKVCVCYNYFRENLRLLMDMIAISIRFMISRETPLQKPPSENFLFLSANSSVFYSFESLGARLRRNMGESCRGLSIEWFLFSLIWPDGVEMRAQRYVRCVCARWRNNENSQMSRRHLERFFFAIATWQRNKRRRQLTRFPLYEGNAL